MPYYGSNAFGLGYGSGAFAHGYGYGSGAFAPAAYGAYGGYGGYGGNGCFGCFGPSDTANLVSLNLHYEAAGVPRDELLRLVRGINAWAPAFRVEGDRLAAGEGAS